MRRIGVYAAMWHTTSVRKLYVRRDAETWCKARWQDGEWHTTTKMWMDPVRGRTASCSTTRWTVI